MLLGILCENIRVIVSPASLIRFLPANPLMELMDETFCINSKQVVVILPCLNLPLAGLLYLNRRYASQVVTTVVAAAEGGWNESQVLGKQVASLLAASAAISLIRASLNTKCPNSLIATTPAAPSKRPGPTFPSDEY